MILIIYLDLLDKIFEKYNFKDKQPLINIFGKSIIEWIIDFIDITKFSNIIIVYNNDKYEYNYMISQGLSEIQRMYLMDFLNIYYKYF